MGTSLIIIVIVGLLLSILFSFDFSWSNIMSASRLDTVFTGRNKEYGAYQIRKNYAKSLVIAMLSTICFVAFALYTPKILFKKEIVKTEKKELDTADKKMIEELLNEEEEKPEEIPPEEKPQTEQLQFTMPEVTNEVVLDPPPTQLDLDTTKAGLKTQQGIDDPNATPVDAPPPPPDPVDETVYSQAELTETPSFPGGEEEMRKFIADNFKVPAVDKEVGQNYTMYVKFVVNRDGSLSVSKVTKAPSDEAEKEAKRIIGLMPKWSPGKNNGKSVKCSMAIPIKVTLN